MAVPLFCQTGTCVAARKGGNQPKCSHDEPTGLKQTGESRERVNLYRRIAIEVRKTLEMQASQDQTMPIVPDDANTNEVMLDANHPIAGRGLISDIEVVGIGND